MEEQSLTVYPSARTHWETGVTPVTAQILRREIPIANTSFVPALNFWMTKTLCPFCVIWGKEESPHDHSGTPLEKSGWESEDSMTSTPDELSITPEPDSFGKLLSEQEDESTCTSY